MTDDLKLIVNNSPKLKEQRDTLVRLLYQDSDSWIEFMDRVGRYLGPILNKAGKPTKEEIAKSLVGANGFTTWKEMIEADLLVGGLGWKFSTYQQWRKAYVIVNAVDGIRDRKFTPAELIRKAKVIKDAGYDDLPATVAEFEERFTQIQDDAKATNISTLKGDIERLEAALAEQLDKYTDLDKKLLEAKLELSSQQDENKLQAERIADNNVWQEKQYHDFKEARAELKSAQDEITEKASEIARLSVIIQTKDDEIDRLKSNHNSAIDEIKETLGKVKTARDEFETELDATCDQLANTQSDLSDANEYKNKLVKYLNLPFWKRLLEKKPEAPKFKPKKR